ncbi:MAG: hypothetical protein HUU33_13780 [Flavobacteriales bacterium]|nr:hypothetical protein [Flavobacteriales bacterium]
MRWLLPIAFVAGALQATAQPVRQVLGPGWRFRELGSGPWWPAQVPGTVQQDLLRHGRIPDPLRNACSDSVQWVELRDWEYVLRFDADTVWTTHPDALLVFKGIDTFADVRLNGVRIGGSDNMFRTWRWPVHGLLREHGNELQVVLRSPVREGAHERAEHGVQLPHDSDPTGVAPYVRKAAYQFGWDFAPRLVTLGIWKEVALELPAAAPAGSMRAAALDQRPDSIGTAFRFVRDGRPFFVKGCNMVPPSMYPGTDSLWVARVRDMQRAGMNMVRVWAGGVYPPDAFFAACDTAGILVWLDLMFAYIPPADSAFLDNVRAEVADQAARLARWPGLVLWCGNNELDVAWGNWGWQDRYRLHGADSARVRQGMTKLFHSTLPNALPPGDRERYVPTSPVSNWGNAHGLRHGDLHYWGVWHGDSSFASFARNVGRFVSEYGFQSYPDSATLATQLDPAHLRLGDPVLAARQRSYKSDRPIQEAIAREFGVRPVTLGDFILFSQLAQAEAYRQAIWAHITGGPHCMGTLFWQLNDVWAGPSWSTVDHTGTWKAAMYEVARSYRPLVMDLRTDGDTVAVAAWNEGVDPGPARLVVQWHRTDGTLARSDTLAVDLARGHQRLFAQRVEVSPTEQARLVVRAALTTTGGAVLAERVRPMRRMGETEWRPAHVTLTPDPQAAGDLLVTTDKPVAVVRLHAPGAEFSDNYFPLTPGPGRRVRVVGAPPAGPAVEVWP